MPPLRAGEVAPQEPEGSDEPEASPPIFASQRNEILPS